MPGEFFTVLFYKNIQTNHFFVAFTCRKAKDRNDDVGSGERWPVIAQAVRERPVDVLAAVGGRTNVPATNLPTAS